MEERVPSGVVLTRANAVPDVEVGVVRGVNTRVLPTVCGQPSQFDCKNPFEEERQEEHGDHYAKEREENG